jgi:hypothetical protein
MGARAWLAAAIAVLFVASVPGSVPAGTATLAGCEVSSERIGESPGMLPLLRALDPGLPAKYGKDLTRFGSEYSIYPHRSMPSSCRRRTIPAVAGTRRWPASSSASRARCAARAHAQG